MANWNGLCKWGFVLMAGALWLGNLVGCQAPSTGSMPHSSTPVRMEAPVKEKTPLEIILAMHREGRITDVDAERLIDAMVQDRIATKSTSVAVTPAASPARSRPIEESTAKIVPIVADEPVAAAGTEGLAVYTPRDAVVGRLRSIGSDTMDKLMQLWEEGFQKHHPSIRLYHEGKGSSTAPPALIEGRSDFGPMSRDIKSSEVEQFKAKFGYEPAQMRVAIDALAVYVHPDNPIVEQGLDFQQLDAIFSSTRNRGAKQDILTWGDLGLTGKWLNAPINVYSRNSASGTYGFFKDHVLKKGDYRKTNRELVGSEALVTSVGQDLYGIGYSGIGYKTSQVATVPLSEEPQAEKFPAEKEYAYSGKYPLARFLYLTVNIPPSGDTPIMQREFMTYVYSREGQSIVAQDGFYPLSPEIATEELANLR